MVYKVKTYYQKKNLPPIEEVQFFHFPSAFDWYGNIPIYQPLMLVTFENEKPIAALFAVFVQTSKVIRHPLFKRCIISQQPSFFKKNLPQNQIFELMINHLVEEVKRKVFLIRYENLGNTTYGYKAFRENHFFSIKWINIRNSLQRKRKIRDQIFTSRKNQVNKALNKGLIVEELQSSNKLHEIYRLFKNTNHKIIRRKFPPYTYFENFFRYYAKHGKGKILLTRYQGKIIGGAILGFEGNKSVYCLYYWGKAKRLKQLYPTVFTLYSAMKQAEEEGFQYFDFMDVGFINKNSGRSRFLLQFGGKQKATRRWYRLNPGLLNFFANRIYN